MCVGGGDKISGLQYLVSKDIITERETRYHTTWFLIVLGFNDLSGLAGHFVSFPREREKR